MFQNLKDLVLLSDDDDGMLSQGAALQPTTKKSNTTADLRQESRICFQKITAHEEALAELIRDLGPAFTSKNLPARLRGMYVLLGAIEGCCSCSASENNSDVNNTISNSCLVLLGNFLSLQCGPIVDDEYEEDYDSMIRDVSIQCLSALVGTGTPPQNSSGAMSDNDFAEAEAMEIRVDFAKKSVERRCAADEDDMVDDEIMDGGADFKDIRGGLSTLPRSKRSLCFTLLRHAVIGVSRVSKSTSTSSLKQNKNEHQSMISSIQRHFIQFADFIARCIPGESDPRCLMQLLELIHATQVAFYEWFTSNVENSTQVFPNEDFFDAVAPYYPIQFTPPPNNIHGITREGLHSELISVLTFTKMDGASRQYHKPTMLGCSINLFLDQLLPGQADEENISTLEKLECMECISSLLFPQDQKETNECVNLTIDEARNLSTALIATHDEASVNVSHGGGDISDQNKVLAETCRNFASRVARELEKCNKNEHALWKTFVSESLDKEGKKLKLTPAYAKTSIAYEASLAASGGPRTLRICLTKGLGPLIEFLSGGLGDPDNTLAAIHGIAAFFSSSQVALSKLKKEGVAITPHPLEAYAMKACNLMLNITETEDQSSDSLSHKSAALSCLECLFLSCTEKDLVSDEVKVRICNFLKGLLRNVVTTVTVNESSEDQDDFDKYQFTSGKVLGRIVGVSLSIRDDEDPNDVLAQTVLMSENVQHCIQTTIFPELKAAAFVSAEGNDGDRYDRLALTTACSSSAKLASAVVAAHLEALLDALKENISSSSTQTSLEALSSILRSCVGDNVIRAFHESDVVDDIIDTLCRDLKEGASPHIRDSISQIALPATTNENEDKIASKIDVVNAIERGLLPAYNRLVPRERLKKLLTAISKKIPPLSQADEYDLLVRLPILSAALQSAGPSVLEDVVSEIDAEEGLPVSQLLQGLTEYVLSADHSSNSRTAAALCVHALLKSGFNRNLDCPMKPLLVDVTKRIIGSSNNLTETKNCLNYLSLLSSAAALRGSSSSFTADATARFLMEAACEGCAKLPFRSDSQCQALDFSVSFKEDYVQIGLQLVSASAYGAILMEDDIKPLMKQRLTHICLKYIKNVSNKEGEQVHIGLLMVVCHVVCASDLSRFDLDTTHRLTKILVRGFSSNIFQVSSQFGTKFQAEAAKARTLVICTLLKLLCIAPKSVDGFVMEMVSGLLRSYGVSDPNTEIGCKLVTLQALEALAHLDGAKAAILDVQPAVITILSSAMSQKSSLLRSAAVDVRNAWCLVD